MQSGPATIHFTDKFFSLPAPEVPDQNEVFPLPRSAITLADFFRKKRGQNYKIILANKIQTLIKFAETNQLPHQTFVAFNQKHQQYDGSDLELNNIRLTFYQEVLMLLSRLCRLIEKTNIPLALRCQVIRDASEYVKLCEPGIHTNLLNSCLKLESYLSIDSKLLHLRLELAQQHALVLLTPYHVEKIVEAHYINGMLNAHANALFIHPINDPYIKDVCEDDILESLIAEFKEKISAILSPTNIIKRIIEQMDIDGLADRCNNGHYQSAVDSLNSTLNTFGPEGDRQFYDLRNIFLLNDDNHYIPNWRAKKTLFHTIRERLLLSGFLKEDVIAVKLEPNVTIYQSPKKNKSEGDNLIQFWYAHTPNQQNNVMYHSLLIFLVEKLLNPEASRKFYIDYVGHYLNVKQRVKLLQFLCKVCKAEGHFHPLTSPARVIQDIMPKPELLKYFHLINAATLDFYFKFILQEDDDSLYQFGLTIANQNKAKTLFGKVPYDTIEQFYLRYYNIISSKEDYHLEVAQAFAYFSVDINSEKLLEQVLSHPRIRIDLNAEHDIGLPLLRSAILQSHDKVVSKLCDQGINVNRTQLSYRPPLFDAIMLNRFNIVDILLKHDVHLIVTIATPLAITIYDAISSTIANSQFLMLEKILTHLTEKNRYLTSNSQVVDLLHCSLLGGSILFETAINYFITNSASLSDAAKKTLITYYYIYTSIPIFEKIIRAFPQDIQTLVNSEEKSLLNTIQSQPLANDHKIKIYKTLFSTYLATTGTKLLTDNYFISIIKRGKFDDLGHLVPQVVGINDKLDAAGSTFLHLLILHGNNKTEDPDQMDNIFDTFPDMDINAQDKQGNTPLHYALRSGKLLLVSLLIRNLAADTIRNKAGQTPAEFGLGYQHSREETISGRETKRLRRSNSSPMLFSSSNNDPVASSTQDLNSRPADQPTNGI